MRVCPDIFPAQRLIVLTFPLLLAGCGERPAPNEPAAVANGLERVTIRIPDMAERLDIP